MMIRYEKEGEDTNEKGGGEEEQDLRDDRLLFLFFPTLRCEKATCICDRSPAGSARNQRHLIGFWNCNSASEPVS